MHKKAFPFMMLSLPLLLLPSTAHSKTDCFNGLIEYTEIDNATYTVQPWYPQKVGMKAARDSVLAAPIFDEELIKETIQADTDGEKKGQKQHEASSLESEIIMGLTDFVVDRAKAVAVQWYMNEMQNELCNGPYYQYFFNTCVMRSQSKDTLPYLPGLVGAFKKDVEMLPANLVCKNFKTSKGYFLTNIVKDIIAGIPPENLVAGLAQNEKIRELCVNSEPSSKQNTCDLFLTGLMAQVYLNNFKTERWIDMLDQINKAIPQELKSKINLNVLLKDPVKRAALTAEQKQYFFRLVRTFKDIEVQVKKIKKAINDGNKNGILLSSTKQISRDVIDIIDNPFANSINGISKNRNYIEPVLNAASAVMSGQYSDALVDVNKIINEYFDYRLSEISDGVKSKLISYIILQESMEFDQAEFKKIDEAINLCDVLYKTYYPQEKKSCQTIADLNAFLKKEDFYLKDLGADFQKRTNALLMILFELQDGKAIYYKGQEKYLMDKLTVMLNRFLLEDARQEVPHGRYCSWPLLEAYYDLFNEDLARRKSTVRLLSVSERLNQAQKPLQVMDGYIADERCGAQLKAISSNIKEFYNDRNIDLISPNNPVQKYIPVIASLATVQNKDEVKNILNETASSVDSWRIKQQKKNAVSFGAMLGGMASRESLNRTSDTGYAGGLFVPIGIDKMYPGNCFFSARCGLFLSLLDLGTVASVRISGDEDNIRDKTDKVSLSEVTAPGLYLHWNMKDSPLVFGFGGSYVPVLRTEEINGKSEDRGGWRAQIFVGFDLPIFLF